MKLIRAVLSTAMGLIVGILLIAPSLPANAQSASDLNGFIGRWQINLSKTKLNRNGPNGKYTQRAATFTNVFSVQGQNLKQDVYEQYPQAAPDRSTTLLADEKEHCTGNCTQTGGPTNGSRVETYVFYKIDSHTVVRLTRVNGKLTEYFTYALSTDGKTMSQIIWSPETPEWQTIYVYDKQQ